MLSHLRQVDNQALVQALGPIAFTDRFDAALLISADSDLVGPIERVRNLFPEKRMMVVFPPARHSNALRNVAHACLHLDRATLIRSVFPDQVTKPDGFVLQRPAQWR
ncbi:MAG: hypothetical protein M8467_03895 [Anaerolineae bacterium]|nr:hypothetical protein [Anaerolineae bacterium]